MKTSNSVVKIRKKKRAQLIDNITDYLVEQSWPAVVDGYARRSRPDVETVLWIPESLDEMVRGKFGEVKSVTRTTSPQYFGTYDGSLPRRIPLWTGMDGEEAPLSHFELEEVSRDKAEFLVDPNCREDEAIWIDGDEISPEEQDLLSRGGEYIRRVDLEDPEIKDDLRNRIRALVEDRIDSLLE